MDTIKLLRAYPHLLFADNGDLIRNADEHVFRAIIQTFPGLVQALQPYIDERLGTKTFNPDLFRYKLQFESIESAQSYIAECGAATTYDLFFDYTKQMIPTATSYVKAFKVFPTGEMLYPMPNEFVKQIVQNGTGSEMAIAIYLMEHHKLIEQHDLFHPNQLNQSLSKVSLAARNHRIEELTYLESKGYKYFVPAHVIEQLEPFAVEAIEIAKRTGLHPSFRISLNHRYQSYIPDTQSRMSRQHRDALMPRSSSRSVSPSRSRSSSRSSSVPVESGILRSQLVPRPKMKAATQAEVMR